MNECNLVAYLDQPETDESRRLKYTYSFIFLDHALCLRVFDEILRGFVDASVHCKFPSTYLRTVRQPFDLVLSTHLAGA